MTLSFSRAVENYLNAFFITQSRPPATVEDIPASCRCLYANRAPSITLTKYIERLVQYMSCSPEVFIVALAMLRRIRDTVGSKKTVPITSLTVHRLYFTCVVIAAKLRDDIYYSMTFYSQVGGVAARELRQMELAVLTMMEWNAGVTPEEYAQQLYALSDIPCGICDGCVHVFDKWSEEPQQQLFPQHHGFDPCDSAEELSPGGMSPALSCTPTSPPFQDPGHKKDCQSVVAWPHDLYIPSVCSRF